MILKAEYNFQINLLNFAKIKNDILFVGLGKTFQVWSPKNFEKFKNFARKKALQSRSTLKWIIITIIKKGGVYEH